MSRWAVSHWRSRREVAALAATILWASAAPPGSAAQELPPEARRVPILLVPGWSDDASDLALLEKRFEGEGWGDSAVVALSFRDPVGSNRAHAREVGRAVAELLESTGSSKADIVAHSMGGLAVRRYLLDSGGAAVRRVVFLATPHLGTRSAYLAWGEGAREMEPGSSFLLELWHGSPVPPAVQAMTIHTPLDLHVLPQESAELPGVANVEVCCPTHAGLLKDLDTYVLILRFLEQA